MNWPMCDNTVDRLRQVRSLKKKKSKYWQLDTQDEILYEALTQKLAKLWIIVGCVLFSLGLTNAQETVTVPCKQTCTVQGDIIQQIRSRLDSLNPTLQCVDAELVESQIIELVKKIHKAENITCEVPKPETIIIDNYIPWPTITVKELWSTWVPEKVITKKKIWK